MPLDAEVFSDEVSLIVESDLLVGDLDKAGSGRIIDVNSGGELYFVWTRSTPGARERAAVVKFGPSRMSTQGEALAYELAHALDAPSPDARILRADSEGWARLHEGVKAIVAAEEEEAEAAAKRKEDEGKEPDGHAEKPSDEGKDEGDDGSVESSEGAGSMTSAGRLLRALGGSKAALLVELVHGPPLAQAPAAFASPRAAVLTAEALGRLLFLDLVLGNSDRLPCRELGWRGNGNNVRFGTSAGAVTGIDHTLPRKPPRMLLCTPHAAATLAAAVLGLDPPAPPPAAKPHGHRRGMGAAPALSGEEVIDDFLGSAGIQEGLSLKEVEEVREAFRRGFRSSLSRGAALHALLATQQAALDVELASFFASLKGQPAGGAEKAKDFGSTRHLRGLQDRAQRDGDLKGALRAAEARMFGAGAELDAQLPGTASFLACDGDMVAVGAHELRTRLEHVLPRLEALLDATRLS